MKKNAQYYSEQLNARAAIPEHPHIFTRWIKEAAEARRASAALLGLAYGEEAEERLDLFPAARANAPLLVFIHGGWWRSLDKSDFSHIGRAYARAGINVALTNYTLAPGATIEDIVIQQLRALAWLYRKAPGYDIDASRIVVAGHSAGAHLAAMLMAARWTDLGLPADLIKGGILMSGLYDLAPVTQADFVNVDLQLDAGRAALLSPAFMPRTAAGGFITAVGAQESEEFQRQTALIGSQWKDGLQGTVPLPGLNHLTICDAFADPAHALFKASLALVDGTAG